MRTPLKMPSRRTRLSLWCLGAGLSACAPQFKQFPQYMARGQLYEATCAVVNERKRGGHYGDPPYLDEANSTVARQLATQLQAKLRVTMVTQQELEERLGPFGATVAARSVIVRVDFQSHRTPERYAELSEVSYLSALNVQLPESRRWMFFGHAPNAAQLSELSAEQIPGSTVHTEGGPGALDRAADAVSRSPLGALSRAMHVLTLGILPDPFRRSHPLPQARTTVSGPSETEIARAAPLATRLHDEFLKETEPSRGAPVQQVRRIEILRRPADELNAPLEIVLDVSLGFTGREDQPSCGAPVRIRLHLAEPLPLAERIEKVFQGQFQPLVTFF